MTRRFAHQHPLAAMRISTRPVLAALLAATIGATAPARAVAQAPAPTAVPRDTAADRQAVLAVVTKLFDAMRKGDSAAAGALFHPKAQLSTALGGPNGPHVEIEEVASFLKAVGTPHTEVWDERIRNPIVHLDGPLGVVWVDYSFYVGEKFNHCGVDVFQIAQTANGWKIIALADTRRRTGCQQ
jgi:hypothetical protein